MPPKRVVLAEYFTTEDRTFLFIVRADCRAPHVIEIQASLEEIRQFVTTYFGAGDKVLQLPLDAWQARFSPFVEPLLSWTDEDDIVWLVPHDVLHYLPLHALQVEGRYFIERNPICYTPSASVMQYCHAKRKGRRERALILADSRPDRPLLHARVEALAIQELFLPAAEVYVGHGATKALVQQRLAEAKDDLDMLHFACHGTFHSDQALRSGIQLAAEEQAQVETIEGDTDRWTLTAEEIFRLEMRADLVTLSACQSGVNERRPGDELIGLTRALLYAGTPSVVVTLWLVDDLATSILMRTFYQALREGSGKAEALQSAQVALQKVTAREVIAYCEEAKRHLTGPEAPEVRRRLHVDIANKQFQARDFEAALSSYTQLRQEVEPASEAYCKFTIAISRCQRALRNPKAVNYEMPVYALPYYWASFVLVGDWQ
jgi:CHAT domain-containing protein